MLERSILSHPRGGREVIVKMISDWLNENTIIVGTHTIDDQYNIDVRGTVVIISELPLDLKIIRASYSKKCQERILNALCLGLNPLVPSGLFLI